MKTIDLEDAEARLVIIPATNLFRCQRCNHRWRQWQPPQPWYGMGYDKDMNLVDDRLPDGQDDKSRWIPPRMPTNPSCPKCGWLYVQSLKSLNVNKRKKKKNLKKRKRTPVRTKTADFE